MGEAVSLERIAEAARVVDPVFLHSPQYVCERLSAELGVTAVLKVECLNPIRSFKGRGTDYLLRRIDAPEHGFVCASGCSMAAKCPPLSLAVQRRISV